MANEKLVTLDALSYFKGKIDTVISQGDAKSFKTVEYANNTIKFYKTEDKSDTPTQISLPEEIFLDQTKTVFVENFTYNADNYPGSTDPSLNGKPVMVLAVKGDTTTAYSFVNLEKLMVTYEGEGTSTANVTVANSKIKADVKVSAKANNAISTETDGLYVATPIEPVYVATDEIDAMFD